MFAKLLKHELKSTGGMLGLLSLAALAAGVIGGLLLRYNMNAPATMEAYEMLSIVSSVALPFVFVSLIAFAIGGEIYLAVQFYKRKFTDQGYLTFTLPVHAWQIYLSSLLNMMLWTFIIILVLVMAFACIFLIGIFDTEVWHRLMEIQMNVRQEIEMGLTELEGISPVYSVIEFISSNVLMITSITLGSVLAKKHKVLGAIGSYYGVSMLISAVNSWLSGMILYDAEPQMQLLFVPSAILNLVVILGGSALSIYLMDKKLNLP